jgi:small-conductance mechanosensitive channel
MLEQLHVWVVAHIVPGIRVVVLAGAGFWLSHQLGRIIVRRGQPRLGAQTAMLISKIAKYGLSLLVLISVLRQLGFDLGAFLGAAGIAGVAIGFASQTSLGNLISGLFLLGERPFKIGDVVEIDGVTGHVDNIALLATYIRTFDNRQVRIPNETIVKARVINDTRFPIRRLDLDIGVAYKEDAGRVMSLLMEIANADPLAMDEPEPVVMFKGLGASSVDFMLGVWIDQADLVTARNSLLSAIKARFEQEGIEIPFPHLSLCAGEGSRPFPVQVVGASPAASREPAMHSGSHESPMVQ